MEGAALHKRLGELAAFVKGELTGDPNVVVSGVQALEAAGPSDLSFYASSKYKKQLESTRAAAVLVGTELPPRDGLPYVRVGNPHLAFAQISTLFHPTSVHPAGQSPQSFVHPEARVHPSATVMAFATVERFAQVGARSVIFPGAYVGERAVVGDDCLLYPNAVVRERCLLGHRVILHPCAVIGADGFGFAFNPEVPEHFKVPQAGIVRIEDDVEIGANSCVDRATAGETVVGRGSKVDNQVQIAHNVKVGPLAILCAQVGIAGSTEIGTGVVMGGKAGAIDHLRIGDLAKVGASASIFQDVEDGAQINGYPAVDVKTWLKNSVVQKDLAGLAKEVRELRRRVQELEKPKS